MASPKLLWELPWQTLWELIPEPAVAGRFFVTLDDAINNKTRRKIFGCGYFHDHTVRLNQPRYPWSQHVVAMFC